MFFERCDLSDTAWTDMVFQQWRPLGCGCLTPQQNTKSATVSLLPGHTKLCVCTYLTNISLYFFMIYCVSFAVFICVSFVKVMNVFFSLFLSFIGVKFVVVYRYTDWHLAYSHISTVRRYICQESEYETRRLLPLWTNTDNFLFAKTKYVLFWFRVRVEAKEFAFIFTLCDHTRCAVGSWIFMHTISN